MKPLDPTQLQDALSNLPGWRCDASAESPPLCRTFTFGSFREAVSFIVRIGFEAEAMDHHPRLVNVYNRVDVELSTHDAGNQVTARDVELARRIESINWTR